MPELAAAPPELASVAPPIPAARVERFRALVDAHYDFLWRSLRRLGVPQASTDDSAQHVCLIAWQKLDAIKPGAERAYLFRTAMGVAANWRRSTQAREHGAAGAPSCDASDTPAEGDPEELLRWKQAREFLDEVLGAMKADQRCVFVLAELEGMTAPEIAAMIEVPLGTVASRLRRAREEFSEAVARLRARESFRGAP